MFHAIFFFLGAATFILAASVCFSRAKRAGKSVEADFTALEAASVCHAAGRRADKAPTWDEIVKWQELKLLWMQWYGQVREKALMKQESMYSWVRTMALCAALCLVGVVLEVTFDQQVTADRILAGFRQSPQVTSLSANAANATTLRGK